MEWQNRHAFKDALKQTYKQTNKQTNKQINKHQKFRILKNEYVAYLGYGLLIKTKKR